MMTPAEKRKNTIIKNIMFARPEMTFEQAEQHYFESQRMRASKGGKNPNSHRGFSDRKLASRAAKKRFGRD